MKGTSVNFAYTLITKGFTVLLHDAKQWEEIIERYHGHSPLKNKHAEEELRLHSIKYEFVGADLSNHSGKLTSESFYNYYLGNDPAKWASGVSKHFKVVYQNAYPNIDIEFEAIDQRFKYNFVLHPRRQIK